MRRIIKPFTVELRSGKRKPPSPLSLPSEQPSVDWPEALLAEFRTAPEPEPARPAGRVLPALDEAPQAMPMREAEVDAAEPAPMLPVGEPHPVVAVEAEAPVAVAVHEATPVPGSPSSSRARLSRDAFAPGERWKARLPAAVHRTRRGVRTERSRP